MFCTNTVKWLYKLERSYTWPSGKSVPRELEFRDAKGKVRLRIAASGEITVTEGYAWDGCTPKFCVFDVLCGVPDGAVHERTGRPKAYYASLVHDAIYQFLTRPEMPYSRKDTDDFFLRLMSETGFAPRYLYYIVVRLFGGIARMISFRFGKRRPVRASP